MSQTKSHEPGKYLVLTLASAGSLLICCTDFSGTGTLLYVCALVIGLIVVNDWK